MADFIVSTNNSVTNIVTSATQGPPGPPGSDSKAYLIAGESLGGNRVLTLSAGQAVYASNLNNNHLGRVIGLSTTAVVSGASVEVIQQGELNGFSGLVQDTKYYLGDNGVLVDSAPSSGFIQQIGVASSSTKLLINIQAPIAR